MMQDKNVVDSYLFMSEEDAELAREEKKKAEYIEKKMDYTHPSGVLRIYQRLVEEKVFRTPVGQDYLRRLRIFLLRSDAVDKNEIYPIPLFTTYALKMRSSYTTPKQYVKVKEKKKTNWLMYSVIFNIVLLLAVAAMFGIATESDNPNVINYENAILDKYADWEQQLTEREKAVREKERDLNIEIE